MTYYKLATMAGINMMPSMLYSVDGNNHFLTRRFDRNGGKKIHTQTLAAIYPDAESYEQLISVCRKLRLPDADCQEVFRRMVFNILSNNTDDHNKNFSFIMNEDGAWRLAPAYDITYIIDRGGYLPNMDHCMYIRPNCMTSHARMSLILPVERNPPSRCYHQRCRFLIETIPYNSS